jgi:anti-sigma factor RsiW
MTTMTRDAHPAEADLVRYLDGELALERINILSDHLVTCSDCALRTAELEEATSWLTGGIELLDAEVRIDELARLRALNAARGAVARHPAGSPAAQTAFLTRIAAVAALLVFGAVAASPVRAWFSEWLTPGIQSESIPPAAQTAEPVRPSLGPPISFRPAGGVFRIELAYPQAVGTITVGVGNSDRATAQLLGAQDESILVLPSGLRVENGPASTASYRIDLPAEPRSSLQIDPGTGVIEEITVAPGDVPVMIDLAGGTSKR